MKAMLIGVSGVSSHAFFEYRQSRKTCRHLEEDQLGLVPLNDAVDACVFHQAIPVHQRKSQWILHMGEKQKQTKYTQKQANMTASEIIAFAVVNAPTTRVVMPINRPTVFLQSSFVREIRKK